MDVESLRTFLAVARTRSISKAAAQLFMTQPAVSQRIQRLERQLGFPVFQRSWKGTELTLQGRHILPTLAEYLISLDTARSLLLTHEEDSATFSIARWHAGPEIIGYDDWLLGQHQNGLIDRIQATGIQVNITVASAPKIQALTSHAICQMGIHYAPQSSHDDAVTSCVLWEEPLCLVHPANEEPPISFSEDHLHQYFSTRSFILMNEPIYTFHSVVTKRFMQNIQPGTINVVDHVDILASLAGTFGNATIIPAGLAARHQALSSNRIRAHILPNEVGTIPVRLDINEHARTRETTAIVEAVKLWAQAIPLDIKTVLSGSR